MSKFLVNRFLRIRYKPTRETFFSVLLSLDFNIFFSLTEVVFDFSLFYIYLRDKACWNFLNQFYANLFNLQIYSVQFCKLFHFVKEPDKRVDLILQCSSIQLQIPINILITFSYIHASKLGLYNQRRISYLPLKKIDESCYKTNARCLAVTLQNERGGRQRCFSIDTSAGL